MKNIFLIFWLAFLMSATVYVSMEKCQNFLRRKKAPSLELWVHVYNFLASLMYVEVGLNNACSQYHKNYFESQLQIVQFFRPISVDILLMSP